MVRHARSFQEIIDRERAAPTLLPSVCATAGSSLASGSDIGSVSPERSLKAALCELHISPTAARAPLQATVCNRPSSAWRIPSQSDREPLDLGVSTYGKAPTAYVRLCCLEEHGEHGENEGPIHHDSVGLDVVGTRQRWSAPMTSVCVSSGAWVAQGLAAAAGAAARGKVALLRWEGAEDAAAWAEQAPSPLATSPCATACLLHCGSPLLPTLTRPRERRPKAPSLWWC